ncbi:MAG: adenylate/guanylate cyclase domain-containing protein [Alphaproteobacteria bacterium]
MVDTGATQRRLAAILAADVAGYSRLMGADEEGTLARLKALRAELIDPAIAAHHGRIVKTTGDGLLVAFASVVDAMRCAIQWQGAMAERSDSDILFRIGVNLGDVIIDDGDIFGDGVNIAARLEGMAEPGGICISRTVLTQTRGKLDFPVEDLGEQSLKNIPQPVHVFRVLADRKAMPEPSLPLPDKPSIAVLPFQNMSGDPEQEYFADGMAEEITTAISRLPWLFVIARNSSFTYKGKSVDVRQVARDLGVRYVLEGSVRKAGQRVRITGQLIDTTMGAHIWADRFDSALDDVFDLQDRVASSVVGAIEPKLRQFEIERASRKPTESLDAYDLYLRALAHSYAYSEKGFTEAVVFLRQALVIDPSYAPAAAMLSFCRTQQQAQGWGALSKADLDEAVGLARQAVEAGRDDPDIMWQAAWPLFRFGGETARAMALVDRALALNPNALTAWVVKGWIYANCDQPEPAVEAFERSLRLSPFDPIRYYATAGLSYAHLAAHRFEQAIEWADRSLHDNPRFTMSIQAKVIAYAHLGRLDEARAELRQLLEITPRLTLRRYQRGVAAAMMPGFFELRVAGLRMAGLPEE